MLHNMQIVVRIEDMAKGTSGRIVVIKARVVWCSGWRRDEFEAMVSRKCGAVSWGTR